MTENADCHVDFEDLRQCGFARCNHLNLQKGFLDSEFAFLSECVYKCGSALLDEEFLLSSGLNLLNN